jgi:hypothetical protein
METAVDDDQTPHAEKPAGRKASGEAGRTPDAGSVPGSTTGLTPEDGPSLAAQPTVPTPPPDSEGPPPAPAEANTDTVEPLVTLEEAVAATDEADPTPEEEHAS